MRKLLSVIRISADTATLLFYLTLIAVLVSYFSFPAVAPYSEYQTCLERTCKSERIDIIEEKEQAYRRMKQCHHSQYEEFQNAIKRKIELVEYKSSKVFSNLEHLKKLNQSTYYTRKQFMISVHELHSFNIFLIEMVDPKVRDAIRMYLSGYFATDFKKNEAIDKLFFSLPKEERVDLILAVQNMVLLNTQMIIKELGMEGSCIIDNFDAFQAISVADKSYLLPGELATGKILLAAYNKAVNPVITASSGSVQKVENGIAYWVSSAKSLGPHTITGTATMTTRDTEKVTDTWSFQYFVLAKCIQIEGNKMNVCYRHVDNLLTISVHDYSPRQIKLRVSAGIQQRQINDSQYTLRITDDGKQKLFVYVDVKGKDGKWVAIGGRKIVVRGLPMPILKIAGKETWLTNEELQKSPEIEIVQGDSDFDIHYKLNKLEIFFVTDNRMHFSKTYTLETNNLLSNSEIAGKIATLRNNDRIVISPLDVIDENGHQVDVAPHTFIVTK